MRSDLEPRTDLSEFGGPFEQRDLCAAAGESEGVRGASDAATGDDGRACPSTRTCHSFCSGRICERSRP